MTRSPSSESIESDLDSEGSNYDETSSDDTSIDIDGLIEIETEELAQITEELEELFGQGQLTTEDPATTQEEEPTLVEETARRSNRLAGQQPSPPPNQPATMSTGQTQLGATGLSINIVSTKKQVQDAQTSRILYKKEDRSKMDADKLAQLMKEGTTTAHKKFDTLNLGIDDAEKLDETYDLQVIIQSMQERHEVFDYHDVFTIVIPNEADETKIDRTVNLYKEYATVTPAEVARSNLWYREWTSDPWYTDNLGFTYEYLKNNSNEDLWVKIAEAHNSYPRSQQGGPLFFILMVEHLLSSSEAAAEALIHRVRNLKISSIQGENVFHAVSLLRGAIARLTHVDALPQDILKNILSVMQTTSVPKFNAQFQHLEEERAREAAWRQKGANGLTVEKVFALAESLYRTMLETDSWTGITTKGSQSVFNVQPGKVTCFNCGGDHTVPNCTKPKDQKRIEANRKVYMEKRGPVNRRGKKIPHKYRAPEKGENLKRVINGNAMYYNKKKQRWVPDRDEAGGATSPPSNVNVAAGSTASTAASTITPAPVVPPSPSTQVPPVQTPTSVQVPPVNVTIGASTPQQDYQERRQLVETSLANTSRSINSALTAFTNELLRF